MEKKQSGNLGLLDRWVWGLTVRMVRLVAATRVADRPDISHMPLERASPDMSVYYVHD
jgi:hypothetical protein